MGKRKLHNSSFYQCDWTGFPMRAAYCYMPTWNKTTNKLIKKGSYCNWESVAAHATHLHERNEIDDAELTKIRDHIESIIHIPVTDAPHYDELLHTKGTLHQQGFHLKCTYPTGPITCVKICSASNEVFDVVISADPDSGKFLFTDYMHQPYGQRDRDVQCFHTTRKKGKTSDRDLCVWYYPNKSLPLNSLASSLFKMQLHGDVILVQQSREASFLPRERYVSYSISQFQDQFTRRKKQKTSDPVSLTPTEYDQLKKEMQSVLNSFEAKASESARPPRETSNAAVCQPMNGRRLAQKYKERGYSGYKPPAAQSDLCVRA